MRRGRFIHRCLKSTYHHSAFNQAKLVNGVDALRDISEFRFSKALRPFSFAVALMSCAIGIRLAMLDGYSDIQRAILILVAGLLAQAGVNLINDMGDWQDLKRGQSQPILALVKRNFIIGLACFALAAILASVLIQQAHQTLLWICMIGLVGAIGYALPPIDLKSRGLAVAFVFWLMGVFMVCGSYLAMGGGWRLSVLLNAVPISLLVSALLLANEIRDYEQDKQRNLKTLSVRIGLTRARSLYLSLVILTILLTILLYLSGFLANPLWLIPSLFFLRKPLSLLSATEGERSALPPLTAKFLLIFGSLYLFALT